MGLTDGDLTSVDNIPAPDFRLSGRRVDANISAVDFDGDIAGYSEKDCLAVFQEAARGAGTVILNLGHLDYMNSRVIMVLITLARCARAAGQRVLAADLSDHFINILRMTGFDDYMPLYVSEQQAVTAARATGAKGA